MSLTGIILAGGKSKRIGQDKAFILFNGKKLIDYSIETLLPHVDEIILSGDPAKYSSIGYRVVPDIYKGCGPIGGLYAALKASNTQKNIICPCDMPNLKPDVFDKVLKHADNQLAVILALSTDELFPVLGFYSKEALPMIKEQIEDHDYKLQNLLARLQAQTIICKDKDIFKNINHISDLK